ncbi:MAG TPA: hypothetical protein VIV63_11620, partial [Steroidobacteraceae bacterium]
NPNAALWRDFPMGVAVDGDFAMVGAEYWDQSNPQAPQLHQTTFLYRRSGTGWVLVRQLAETVVNCCVPRNLLSVAMSNGVAAASTTPMTIYELGSSGWTLAPSSIPIGNNSGFDLEIDNGRIINNEGACSWDAGIIERSPDGVWRKAATLTGATRTCESSYAGSVDISGDRAVVHQENGPEFPYGEQQTWIFRRQGAQGWAREGVAALPIIWPAEQRLFSYNTHAAISGADVFVGSGIVNGIKLYRDVPGQGFQMVDRIRPADGAMGGGDSAQLKTSGNYLLQKTVLFDGSYSPTVLNVYRRGADARYEHVAALVRRGATEWNGPGYEQSWSNVAISGRTVLASGLNQVYHFELPATLAAPQPLQETFNTGVAANWATSAGSQFAVVRGDRSRVLRQSQTAIDTRAIYEPANWTNQAIEVDVKANQFADDSAAISLITRWQGPDNFYEFVRGPHRMEFRRMASGTLRTLWSVPVSATDFFPTGRNFRLRLESIGARHQVFVDGRVYFSLFSTGPTRGRVGIATYRAGADFDNVQVTPTPLYSIYRNYLSTAEPWPLASTVGDWRMEEGYNSVYRLAQFSTAGETRVTMGTPTADQRVEARARVIEFASPTGTQRRWFGVVARYVDEGNFYTLALRNSNTLVLSKRVNGQDTTLGSFAASVVPEQYYLIRLDATGNQLRAYLNDRLLFEATDDAHAIGSTGLATFRAHAEFAYYLAYQP